MDMVWEKIILKFILHCTTHSEIFVRSWFRLTVLVVISFTLENKEVLSAKGFGLERKPFRQVVYVNHEQLRSQI